MANPKLVKTLTEFREVLSAGTGIVVTDNATGNHFHADPNGCPGIRERYFEEKVIENGGRSGSYFSAGSNEDAQVIWPDVALCQRCK